MSTTIETLRAPRQMPWAAAVLALLVVLTVTVIATTVSVTGYRTDASFVGRHLVNAPTEFSGDLNDGTATGTAANTPSELAGVTLGAKGGAGISFVRHVPRYGMGAHASEQASAPMGGNTPSEISGGLPKTSQAEIWARTHIRAR